MRIMITADSTCDLSPELQQQYGVELIPLLIVKGDQVFKDGVEIHPRDVFDYVESGQGVCGTSALNAADYHQVFARYAGDCEALIHFSISSGFSSTCQNAALAAADFDNVYVVDTRNLSTGSGLLVLAGRELADQGVAAADIVRRLEVLRDRVEASFVIDTLEYLRRGGRCSSVAALATGILKIKPCIEVVDGGMKVGKKYRGGFENCVRQYVRNRLEGRRDLDCRRIFVTHTGCDPKLVTAVKGEIARYQAFDEVLETVAGCTVSSHCGPNTLGILFLRK